MLKQLTLKLTVLLVSLGYIAGAGAANLWITNAPEIIQPTDVIDLKLQYVAGQDSDLVVTLFDQENGWSWVNGQEYRIPVVSGASFEDLDIEVANLAANRDYKIKAELRPQGGNYSTTLVETWFDIRVSSNSLEIVEADTQIAPNYSVAYRFEYDVEEDMDLVVGFYDQNYGWVFGEEYRYEIAAGSGSRLKVFHLKDLGGLNPGETYKLKAELRPSGAGYQHATEVLWEDIYVLGANEIAFDNQHDDALEVNFSYGGRSVYYNSAQDAELAVVLLDSTDWSWASAEQVTSVKAGNGNAYIYDFAASNLVPNRKYVWKTQLRPVGGGDHNAYASSYLDAKAVTDKIEPLEDMPQAVVTDGVVSVTAKASLTEERDLVFLLFNADDYSYASAPVTRRSYEGVGSYSVDFNTSGLNPGGNYLWKVELRTAGGSWQDVIDEKWAPVTVLNDYVSIAELPFEVSKGDDFVLGLESVMTAERTLSVYLGDNTKPKSYGDIIRESIVLAPGTSTPSYTLSTGNLNVGDVIKVEIRLFSGISGPGNYVLNRIDASVLVTE